MIVLDTHAWIWWASGAPRLTARVRERLDAAEKVAVSPISCWELAMLVATGRINLGREPLQWVRLALTRPGTSLAAIVPEIAVMAAQIDGAMHGDPADRIIVATALHLRVPLVTSDQRIRNSGLVEVVW